MLFALTRLRASRESNASLPARVAGRDVPPPRGRGPHSQEGGSSMFWSRMFKRWRKAWTARRSPKACRRPPARPWLEPLEDRFCPDSTTWKAMAAGAWDNRDNWTDGVPDATKDAIFNATANTNVNSETVDAVAKTISIDGYTANIKLQSLTLGSATASGTSTIKSGTITITYGAAFGLDLFGTLDFSGGTISTGTPPRPLIPPDFKVESGATANISGTANFAGSFDLFNDGSVTVSTSNNIVLGSGARVENYGTLIVQTDITFVGSVFQGRGEFDNIGGTFQKTAGTGTTTVQLPFTNTGTFEVRTGTVSLTDPGDQKQTSGTTTIYAGARLAVV